MDRKDGPGFTIERGDNDPNYPYGYWYVCTYDGNYDADGSTIEIAMARLIRELHEALKRIEGKI